MRRVRVLASVGLTVVGLFLILVVAGARMLLGQPGTQDLELPEDAIALESEAGQELLEGARVADHAALLDALQTQERGAWCGVASAIAVLNAADDPDLTQAGLFTPEAAAVRSSLQVTLGGMALADLVGLVRAHEHDAEAHFAEDESQATFAAEAERNLANPGDFLVVNYDREVVGEVGSGHISPVSALSADGRYVLVLDTASYKYPPHWVPTEALFRAMDTPDSGSGRSRGWVVVR